MLKTTGLKSLASPIPHCYFENHFGMVILMLTSSLWQIWSFSVPLPYGTTQFN